MAGGLAAAVAALLASKEDLEDSDDEEEGASVGTVGVWRVAWMAVELLGTHDVEVARRGLSVLNNLAAAIVGTNACCTRYARCTYCMLHIMLTAHSALGAAWPPCAPTPTHPHGVHSRRHAREL